MAFDITKFQREHKKITADKKALQARVDSFDSEKALAIEAAVELAVQPLQDRLRERQESLIVQALRIRDAQVELDQLHRRRLELESEKYQLTAQLQAAERDRDTWKEHHDSQLPHVIEADKKVADLTALIDGFRDRMRRRELEAEQAILNRKAVASVAPAPLRR